MADTFNTFSSEQLSTDPVTGTLVSSIFDTTGPSSFSTLTYAATTPTNTSATVYVRTGNSPTLTDATAFTSCSAISSGSNASSNACVTNTNRYSQYEIVLTTTDHVSTPTFTVSLSLILNILYISRKLSATPKRHITRMPIFELDEYVTHLYYK